MLELAPFASHSSTLLQIYKTALISKKFNSKDRSELKNYRRHFKTRTGKFEGRKIHANCLVCHTSMIAAPQI